MAIAVVNKKQTGSGQVASLTAGSGFVKPAAGNVLAVMLGTNLTTGTPTMADNLGSSGWTVEAIHGTSSVSTSLLWFAYKTAVGTETELLPTAGAGGTVQGMAYWELSGASTTIDAISHSDNNVNATSATSAPITTTDAGDIVLAGLFFGGAAFGAMEPWTPEAMKSVETTSSRCPGASDLPGTTLTGATFTAKWTTAHASTILLVAIKPSGGATGLLAGTVTVKTSATAPLSARAALAGAVAVKTADSARVAAQAAIGGSANTRIQASSTQTAMAALAGSPKVRISAAAALLGSSTGTLSGAAIVKIGASAPLRAQAVFRATVGIKVAGVALLGASASIAGQVKVRSTSTGSLAAIGGLSGAVKTRISFLASLAAQASIAASARVVIGSSVSIASAGGSRGALIVYTTIVAAPRIPLTVTQSPRLALTVEKPKAIPHTTQVE